MKKLALLMVVLLAVGGQASAIVGYDCPDDADVCIMNGGDDNQTGNQTEDKNDVVISADSNVLAGIGLSAIILLGIGVYFKYY